MQGIGSMENRLHRQMSVEARKFSPVGQRERQQISIRDLGRLQQMPPLGPFQMKQ